MVPNRFSPLVIDSGSINQLCSFLDILVGINRSRAAVLRELYAVALTVTKLACAQETVGVLLLTCTAPYVHKKTVYLFLGGG